MVAMLFASLPTVAIAQADYGYRLSSMDGQWLLPVASVLLGSDESDHLRRGSVNAWDLSASVGSPVWAMGPGRVSYAGCNNQGGYGCWVMVAHGGGLTSTYAHCLERSIRVAAGQSVDSNTQLCNVGRTGMTSWPHVHFVIKVNGVHQRIDQFFNRQQMYYCHFTRCQATNAPDAPVQGIQPSGYGNQAMVIQSPGQRFTQAALTIITGIEPGQLVSLLFVSILGGLWSFWLANNAVRVVMVCIVVSGVVGGAVAILLMPTQTVSAGQPSQQLSGLGTGATWEIAHQLTVGSEGWKCTNDGAYTAGGITQGTYNAWRQSKGLPVADVCKTLTRDERKAIFYERYWLASGADRLPPALALTYVDHAFNAGIGAAQQGLAACGNNSVCYNNWREQSYRAMWGCFLYCRGWINRVNKFRSLTEK